MNKKYSKLLWLRRQYALLKYRIKLPIQLIKSKFWNSESYYPELPNHKSRFRIFCELMGHIWKYGSIERYYFAYGFDVKGFRQKKEYLDEEYFLDKLFTIDAIDSKYNYICLLRDKSLFSDLLSLWQYETPRIIGVTDTNENARNVCEEMFNHKDTYFCKPVDGQCGEGVFKVKIESNSCSINEDCYALEDAKQLIHQKFVDSQYVVQKCIEQLPEINAIYPKSINTLRLVTIYDKSSNKVIPFVACYRVGVGKNTVDNWAQGGLIIGVEIETGKLRKYGYYKEGYGTKTAIHPNTGFVFENHQLPQYHDACQKAINLHAKMIGIPLIGWDIAFTINGPMFIEGNDNFEIALHQVSMEKGYKKEFVKYFKK